MARPPRLQAPGSIHHITARGNERREVFRDDRDREDYLERLARYRSQFGIRLYAFCLMPNHVHLAVKQDPGSLSEFMHSLHSSYTQGFNRRHERVGHVFQGRFKSFLVASGNYFLALIRYIHNNPVKAGLVEDPGTYRWSSDRFYRNGVGPSWLDLDQALELLGSSRTDAVRQYSVVMADPGRVPDYEALVAHGRVVKGDESFAKAALRNCSRPCDRNLAWTAETVANAIAIAAGVSIDDLIGRNRSRELARLRLICAYLGRERFGIPIAESARLFSRDDATLGRRVASLREQMETDQALRGIVEKIGNKAGLPA